MNYSFLYSQIQKEAQGRWLSILSQLAPNLNEAISRLPRHVPCPFHGGKDGFRFFKDAAENGAGICNTCGHFSNGIKLLQKAHQWTFQESLKAISDFLNLNETPKPKCDFYPSHLPTHSKFKNDPKRRERIEKVWNESVLSTHPLSSPLHAYFRNRGLDGLSQIPSIIRLHPSLAYYDGDKKIGRFPCMVTKIEDENCNLLSLHRTYLTQEGKKAPINSPKKIMPLSSEGKFQGAAIRLYEPQETLAVAEGIETALAIHLATELPVWSSISAEGMKTLIVPKRVRKIFIFADLDQSGTGEKAARILAGRLLREDREARIVQIPPELSKNEKSCDWLDIYSGRVRV